MGNQVADLLNATGFPTVPSSRNSFASATFLSPENWSNNYGQKIYGRFKAPQTGNYIFWTAAGDSSELYLGTNGSASSKVLIAYQDTAVPFNTTGEWTTYASQQSPPQYLVAGQFYYLEALMKTGVGSKDFLSVAVTFPDGTHMAPMTVEPYFYFPGSIHSLFILLNVRKCPCY